MGSLEIGAVFEPMPERLCFLLIRPEIGDIGHGGARTKLADLAFIAVELRLRRLDFGLKSVEARRTRSADLALHLLRHLGVSLQSGKRLSSAATKTSAGQFEKTTQLRVVLHEIPKSRHGTKPRQRLLFQFIRAVQHVLVLLHPLRVIVHLLIHRGIGLIKQGLHIDMLANILVDQRLSLLYKGLCLAGYLQPRLYGLNLAACAL